MKSAVVKQRFSVARTLEIAKVDSLQNSDNTKQTNRVQFKRLFSDLDYSAIYIEKPKSLIRRGGRYFSSSYWGRILNERDNGICQYCKIDTYRVRNILRKSMKASRKSKMARRIQDRFRWAVDWDMCGDHRVKFCLWEVDHITPIRLGGADSLENIRTLCKQCHKEATSRFHAHLARLKREGLSHV